VRRVHLVLPDGVDDPARPSGGNRYDRRVSDGLAALGWSVVEHGMEGPWPDRSAPALAAVAALLAGLPDGAVTVLDGLVACAIPEVLLPHAGRLALIVLVHMPLGHRPAPGRAEIIRTREAAVLEAAAAIVTTSRWTQRRLGELYDLRGEPSHVCHPGVDVAPIAAGTPHGGRLVCVAALTPDKGQDRLIDALGSVVELSWQLVCVGALDRDPGFTAEVRRRIDTYGLGDRVTLAGPRVGAALDADYAAADLVILASRAETYGMVLTEALARGLPVIALDVGGVSEAVGHDSHGAVPGLLCPADEPGGLGRALGDWLSDSALRSRLRASARERRDTLAGWEATAATLERVLEPLGTGQSASKRVDSA
jgi:glycosyltransferase involved in cell wall biosynthesis